MIGWLERLLERGANLAAGHPEFLIGVAVGILVAMLFSTGRRLS